jgi:hypothetical protein
MGHLRKVPLLLSGSAAPRPTLARAMPRFLCNNATSKPKNQEVVVQSPTDPATTRDESGAPVAQPVRPKSMPDGQIKPIDSTLR